ncbi:MAG: outer membrane receptor protein involved in Fe transport [Candidatus Paceibacteria bacterium]|jgi:outer membrane receptor protein involved in Fe transport
MIDAWRFLARVSDYDEWFDSFENDVFGTNVVFDVKMLLDLGVAYDFNEHASILVGGNNVFNNSGQKATDVNNIGSNSASVLGSTYSQCSPFGISGACWFGRFQYTR